MKVQTLSLMPFRGVLGPEKSMLRGFEERWTQRGQAQGDDGAHRPAGAAHQCAGGRL